MFVSVAVPVAVMLTPMLPVAFTVNVVLITAAWALAHTSRAKAKLENVRFIGLLESSTRETQEYGEIQLMQHSAAPHSGGLTLRVYIGHRSPSTGNPLSGARLESGETVGFLFCGQYPSVCSTLGWE